ncbi:hypothetical protein SAMN05660772_02091 [Pasteurella testudinis DSM 23072]|uniref:Uncharacterized protein n=1 Tax=Pasteurella testudinis DSM 23072 TaxID=1122938 RepID=A0A1W1UN22_9PAST|nr:hypothetical protein [Pasteurella testudinis]SMB82389.1 hypothetical protein SAMN05660772_02091 [Pasteurella testudinis DSM 23072]SUB52223.1 Uncharacterised protein [Pasteurella testudinis]
MSNVYLALYKGRKTGNNPTALLARFSDWFTRKLTRGEYSHCEIAYLSYDGNYCCRSASIRDGGVRQKIMPLPPDKWDLIPVELDEDRLIWFFYRTQGKRYDWFGAVGIVLPFRHAKSKYFCSEWCAEMLELEKPEQYSPNDLAALYHKK